MAQHIGTFTRSLEVAGDTQADDDVFSLDYTQVDSFATPNKLTTLTLTIETPPSGVTAPTLGSPDYTTDNVPAFRVSGGSAGDVRVRAVAVNSESTPKKVVRTFTISTK